MRRVLTIAILLCAIAFPAAAMEFIPPDAPDEVRDLMPAEKETFAQGLWTVVKEGLRLAVPEVSAACGVCLSIITVVMLISMLHSIFSDGGHILEWGGSLLIASVLLGPANSLIHLGAETVTRMSEYGKLLLPVMTAAVAAEGGMTASAALYGGTVVFDTLLTTAVAKLLVPMVYLFLVLAVAHNATGDDALKKLGGLVKWLMNWFLKIALYVFTGYMTVTGVVSGTADAAAIKATKLTISGMVPVVGGILSDASEAIVVGAGVMKNAAGIYGLLAVIAIWVTPFLQIGLQYLLFKLTAAICATFGIKQASVLIEDFSAAMGFLLAMTGTVCFFLLISTVCFMKGVR